METERLPRNYILGIYLLSRRNENERFLTDDESRDCVSMVMAKRSATSKTKILVYGVLPRLVSWYVNVLTASRCPIDIIVEGNDVGFISRFPLEVQKRITCWRRVTESKENEHHFLLFGQNTYLFDGKGNGTVWVGNFNEPDTAQRLRDRFEQHLKESVPAPIPQ